MSDGCQIREGWRPSSRPPIELRLSHEAPFPRPTRGEEIAALARRARDGDEVAFTRWVEATWPLATRCVLAVVGSRAEAEDVCQEVYVKAWQKMSELRAPEASVAWLLTLSRRASVDRLRSRKVHETIDDELPSARVAAALVSGDTPADALLESAEAKAVLRHAMADLDGDHRDVLMLREVEGLSAPEVPSLLGVAVGTVESRTHRAKQALKKILTKRASARATVSTAVRA